MYVTLKLLETCNGSGARWPGMVFSLPCYSIGFFATVTDIITENTRRNVSHSANVKLRHMKATIWEKMFAKTHLVSALPEALQEH